MTFRAGGLLMAAIFALSLTSCITVDNRMGSDLIPSNHIMHIYTADFEAPMFTAIADSLNMSYPAYLEFGSLSTPLFGKTTSACVVQIAPYTYQNEYGPDPVVQSMSVHIPVSGFTIFDAVERYEPQNVYVYKLVKDLDHLHVYHNSFSADYIDPIPVNKPGHVYLGGDTLYIEFKESFAYELLQADSAERVNPDEFVKRFKGLCFATEEYKGIAPGGRINYLDVEEASIYLDYKSGDGDSLVTYFFNTYDTFYNISTHESSHLANKEPDRHLYYEGLAGVKPCLDATALAEQIKTWGNEQTPPIQTEFLLISRAQLVMPVPVPVDGDYSQVNNAPTQLFPCTLTPNDTLVIHSPLREINQEEHGGSMNRTHWEYTYDITSYIQDLVKKSELTEKDNLWILPTYSYTTTQGEVYQVDNFTYRNTIFNGNLSERPPYIRITYAVLQQ
ncbi:MAG: DUF4270 family protein [Bacteroidales bacterium]|jgi:hypothetical protein